MKRSEFIARALFKGFTTMDDAEQLADEYAKTYPFDDDGVSEGVNDGVDPYAVNWDKVPEECTHVTRTDDNLIEYWTGKPSLRDRVWGESEEINMFYIGFKKSDLPNPNWRGSLRERPKSKMKQPRRNKGIKRRPEDLRIIRLERELSIALQRIAELEKAAIGTEYWFLAEKKHEERLKQ